MWGRSLLAAQAAGMDWTAIPKDRERKERLGRRHEICERPTWDGWTFSGVCVPIVEGFQGEGRQVDWAGVAVFRCVSKPAILGVPLIWQDRDRAFADKNICAW